MHTFSIFSSALVTIEFIHIFQAFFTGTILLVPMNNIDDMNYMDKWFKQIRNNKNNIHSYIYSKIVYNHNKPMYKTNAY